MEDRVSGPNEALAAQIVDRLIEEGLIRAADARKTAGKLAQGELSAEDWRFLIENAVVGR